MWAKGRFSHMAEFAAKAKELGFIHLEANASIFPRMISELLESTVSISILPARRYYQPEESPQVAFL